MKSLQSIHFFHVSFYFFLKVITPKIFNVILEKDIPETHISPIEINYSYMTDKFYSHEMPIVSIGDFKINNSYIEVPSAKKSQYKNIQRSKTTNDCRKDLPKKYKEKKDVDFTDIPCKSSFHMFKILKKIGNGAYGRVFLVRLGSFYFLTNFLKVKNKVNRQKYAMKVLNKKYLLEKKQLRYAVREKNILKLIDHPFIIKLHASFQVMIPFNLLDNF
jgi:hypothetical protein